MDISMNEMKEKFLKSDWPKTDQYVAELIKIKGVDVKNIFKEGLKSRRHIIRTASIKGIVSYGDENDEELLTPYLADKSYETRMEAKNGIKTITGKDVLTAKGE